MPVDVENLSLFMAVVAAWGFLSPLLISLIKNIGGEWPSIVKKLVALAFAVIGGYVAYGVAESWSLADFLDIETVLAAWGAVWAVAQVSYASFWSGTAPDSKLAAVGASNGDAG